MNRGIPKPLIIEPSPTIQPIEILLIRLAPEKVEVADLKVAEELTVIVVVGIGWVEQPGDVGVGVDEVGVGIDERAGAGPEGGEGSGVVEDVHVEAVF